MYSVVMATLLLTGGEATSFGHGCHGCHGCHGYPGYNYGCSCSGCYGCRGCYGCSCWGSYCSCSCWGSSCSCACWGYSYYSACTGCWCSGCCGGNFCSCSGVVIAMPGYSSCSCSCTCSGYGIGGGYPATPGPGGEIVPAPKTGGPSMPPADSSTAPRNDAERDPKAPAAPARLTVRLPADARLWVDQVECPMTSSERAFNTPVLQPGQTYYYTLKISVQRQGAPVTDSQRVLVRAGQSVNVIFNEPEAITTAQR
jgi:uncharacterized protein (TIGR03000 family)